MWEGNEPGPEPASEQQIIPSISKNLELKIYTHSSISFSNLQNQQNMTLSSINH
jgi:hypothetical protein